MNPVIVIPSYWSGGEVPRQAGTVGAYDHATPIDKPVPELQTCLASLESVRGVLRVVILLVAPSACEKAARARVDGICRLHRSLNPLVVGAAEAELVTSVVERVAPRVAGSPVSLGGYGAIRNMGLAVAGVLGHDVVVFLDDDEVALGESFLLDAVFGLGLKNRQGLPILAKSGYYLDDHDSPFANVNRPALQDRHWSKREEFNLWMRRALEATRISRSSYVCGGCFAVAAQAFCSVAFDPVIPRGEDLDYLFNLRMHGLDVWFDNQWRVRHLPPETPSRAARFLQDAYRWEYELAKLARGNAMIGMRKVHAESLRPYPASWIAPGVRSRISRTALVRAVLGPERLAYLRIWLSGRLQAREWAARESMSYFLFQTHWPKIMAALWNNEPLARRICAMGTPRSVGRDPREVSE